MEPIDLRNYLSELFESHEIPFHTEEEWIVPYGKLPAIRATWFQNESTGVFEVEVLLEDQRIINECFSGSGIGKEGILSGLENFCVNSFHVLTSAFWGQHQSDQVEIESWTINNLKYNAYIGNFGTRSTSGVESKIPKSLFNSIESSIKQTDLKNDISWFRFFFANISGDFTFEALKENEDWARGISMLKSQPWEAPEGYYSVRNFVVLKIA